MSSGGFKKGGGVKRIREGCVSRQKYSLEDTKDLEKHADIYLPYKCYISSTGHHNFKLKYKNILHYVLSALGLIEKVKIIAVEIGFTLDATEVCNTTKKGNILAGFKIVDKDVKFPITNRCIFQCDAHKLDNGGVDKSIFYKNEIINCIPLHFCVGKEYFNFL